jgi:hypothetical protein
VERTSAATGTPTRFFPPAHRGVRLISSYHPPTYPPHRACMRRLASRFRPCCSLCTNLRQNEPSSCLYHHFLIIVFVLFVFFLRAHTHKHGRTDERERKDLTPACLYLPLWPEGPDRSLHSALPPCSLHYALEFLANVCTVTLGKFIIVYFL